MNFLDSLVLPQSLEHIELLHYIFMLLLFLFIPFISVLLGGTALSLYLRRKGLSTGNPDYIQLSREIINTVTINKSIGIILGIMPLLTSVLIFAQLLHTTGAYAVMYILLSFFFAAIGIILIYTYRYSVSFNDMFDTIKDLKIESVEFRNEVNKYREGTKTLSRSSGTYGFILLIISLYLFIAGQSIVTYILGAGDSAIFNLFSIIVIIRFLEFLAASAALTGGTLLFAFFYWEGGKNFHSSKYKELVRKIAMNLSIAGGLVLPLFLTIDILALPSNSVSGSVVAYAIAGIILLFLAYHFLYAMLKEVNIRYSAHLFYFFLFAIMAFIIKDQLAMGNATRPLSAILASQYQVYLSTLKGPEQAGAQVSGEQIYKNICTSCHSFDKKIVGPPYRETLPKYEGKLNQLVAFIRNPSKVNPNYPPMPNPGLKPNEAQAVAEYILKSYK